MKINHLNIFLTAGCLILLMTIASGCLYENNEKASDELPSNQYIAISESCVNFGTIIDNYNNISIANVPSPEVTEPFKYNNSWAARWLSTNNSSLKSVYGYQTFYNDPAYNHSLNVSGIYGYPYTLQSGLTIMNIFKNGTINATFNNIPVVIMAGESWRCPTNTTFIAKKKLITLNPDRSFGDGIFTLRYNSTYTVTNMGVYPKKA